MKRLPKNIFKHVSYLETQDYGKVACNGMIYSNKNETIIFDTPANAIASKELINWIGRRHIKGVIATHFHRDCLGGLNQFHSNGIASYASNLTIELAKENGNPVPQNGFDETFEINVGLQKVMARYFGEGHTKDNVIGYIENEKVMFGGCLIKSLGAGKGNLSDANTEQWPLTVSKIKKEFPETAIIVPGHGKNGGIELLDFTIRLFTGE